MNSDKLNNNFNSLNSAVFDEQSREKTKKYSRLIMVMRTGSSSLVGIKKTRFHKIELF